MLKKMVLTGLLAASALGWGAGPCGAAGEFGDLAVHPAPPAPPLPGAGKVLRDPTYGTTILQVTDEHDGKRAYHAYSQWSPFNSNSTRFLIYIEGEGPILYDFDPNAMTAKKVGRLPPTVDGNLDLMAAQWDATDPDVLYATIPSQTLRRLYRYNVAEGAAVLLHDFTSEVPAGGWTSGLNASADSRYFCFWVSTKGGQNSAKTVVVYDRGQDKVYRRDLTEAEVGHGVHSLGMDKGGGYVVISATPIDAKVQPRWLVWRFADNHLEALMADAETKAGGHGEEGYGILVHGNNWVGGQVLLRPLGDPRRMRVVFEVPSKEGKAQWQTDYHFSWNHGDKRYFFLDSMTIWRTANWVRSNDHVFKAPDWSRSHPSHATPEEVAHNGRVLQRSDGQPAKPGQWFFDKGADALFVWPADGADLTQAGQHVIALDWRPFQDEIVQVWIDEPGNTMKARRLAHHQSRVASRVVYLDEPHAASDWSGRFVMFTSNWGGRARQDVFILKVPAAPPQATGPKAGGPEAVRSMREEAR